MKTVFIHWISVLTTKYPYLVNNTAQHWRVVQQNVQHSVVFDSPGCKKMLLKIASIDVYSLNITSYLSAMNRINTFNRHVGKIYRIITYIFQKKTIIDLFGKILLHFLVS